MELCSGLPFWQVRYRNFNTIIIHRDLSRISYYSVASTKNATFVIGGWNGLSNLDVIAKFKDNAWSLYGNLQKPRCNHASITSADMTMIIGGATSNG